MNEAFISRWGHPEADDNGWLHVPGWIMSNYHAFKNTEGKRVGLTSREFEFMCQVMSFKYDSACASASPGLPTVAKRMGIDTRSARRIKDALVEKGAMTIEYRDGMSSIYEFGELVSQCFECYKASLTPDRTVTPDNIVTPDKTVKGTPDRTVTPPRTELSPEEEEIRIRKEEGEVKSARAEDKPAIEVLPKPESVKGTPQGAAKSEYLEQVKMAWGVAGGTANNIFKQMFGLSTDEDRKDNPIDKPLGLNDIVPFEKWYKTKNPDITMPRNAEPLANWVHKYWLEHDKPIITHPSHKPAVPDIQPEQAPEVVAANLAMLENLDDDTELGETA